MSSPSEFLSNADSARSVLSPFKILIVDDSESDRAIYRRYLESDALMCEILEADTLETGLALWYSTRPDIVLLDRSLPDGEGREFLDAIRVDRPDGQLPAIALTDRENERVAARAMKAGAADYQVKEELTAASLCASVRQVRERALRVRQQERARKQAEVIREIALRIRRSLDLDEVLTAIVREAREFLRADRAIVFQFTPDRSGMVVAESVIPPWSACLNERIVDTCFRENLGGDYRQGKIFVADDIYTANLSDCHRQLLERFQVRANLVVPILLPHGTTDSLWGLLVVHFCGTFYRWEESDIGFARELAVQSAIAIQQANLMRELQTLNATLEKQVEERTRDLAASERKFRGIFNNTFNFTSLLTPDGILLEVNQTALNFRGLRAGEVVDRPFAETPWWDISAETRDRLRESIARAARGEFIRYEVEILDAENRAFPIDFSLRPLRDESGEVVTLIAEGRDIRSAKRTEATLRLQAQILDEISDAVVSTDVDGMIISWNRGAERLYGYTAVEAIGRNINFLYDDPDEFTRRVLEPLASDGSYETEVRVRSKTGESVQIGLRLSSVYDERGRLVRWIGCGNDITQQVRAEERSLYLSDRLNLALKAGKIGTWDWNLGRELSWDERMYEIYGLRDLDRPLTYQDWLERVHPDDRPELDDALPEVLQGDRAFDTEFRIVRPDGEIRWIASIAIVQKDSRGRPARMVGINHDITERKQAGENLARYAREVEDLYNNAPCGYHSLDAEGRFIQVNETELQWLGYSREEMLGRSIGDFLSPSSRQDCREGWPLFQERGWIQNIECDLIRKDGSILPALISATVVKDAGGNYLYSRATLMDIRERQQAERVIRQQARRETLLREITQRIRQSLDLRTIFDTACGEIRAVLMADRVGIFQFLPDCQYQDGQFVAESVVGEFPSVLGIPVHDHCFGDNYAQLYTNGRCHAVDDIYSGGLSTCHTDILARFQVRANLVMPLLCGETLWGLLCVHQCLTVRHWQEFEIEFTKQLANQLAIAIQQADLYERVQTELSVRQRAEARIALQLRQQETLGAIVQKIRESLDIEEILVTVTRQVREVLSADRAIVARFFPDGSDRIVEESVSGDFPSLKHFDWREEAGAREPFAGQGRGTPRIIADALADLPNDRRAEYVREGRIRSAIVAPILRDALDDEIGSRAATRETRGPWGGLAVHACREKRVWQESEARLLQQIADQLAIALQQATLFDRLQQELRERQQAQQELTRRNRELAVSNEELARATRLKDEFLANMSHELRTPLTAILGMAEAMTEGIFGGITPQQGRALQTIERSGSHLLELINEILDVSKIEAGQLELDLAPTPIAPLCRSSLAFIRQQALKKDVRVEIELFGELPDVLVDERRVRQVLINLLNNAVKFTPSGGSIRLKVDRPGPAISAAPAFPEAIAVCPGEPSGAIAFLRFSVIDTGIGIAPENLDKLFQPFIQIDSALNRQYSGTGLGLALVKRIVELHGGRVGVTSQLGSGSCFTIDLPVAAPTCPLSAAIAGDENLAIETFSNPETDSTEGTGSRPLILLAEDNDANIMTLSGYLQARGYRLILAKNGAEAVALARSETPDLILMDVQMPEMDGLEAIRQIRGQGDPIDPPIIALTALAMPADRENCLNAGATDYLGKPIKLKELVAKIGQLLASRPKKL
ncbi:PAS domain S-box protein [Pannus brasiliensis CCIBt3594]|uniref:histidine kinase n=1 Tax=Pannus brasiliensis CCIBt3594 TaxID=1427578 RepID=A0AAW9QWW5_9CHRO